MPHERGLAHDAVGRHGENMQKAVEKKEIERVNPRIATETAIACRPFTSCVPAHTADAVMRNFSEEGAYIETSHEFKPGTFLHMRMVRYPPTTSFTAGETQPRSICLAEVKWQQDLADDNEIRFGIGLRYLD